MLFPNEYYGYHSRKKRYEKSKKKSQKGEPFFQKHMYSPDPKQSKNYKRNSSVPRSQKLSDKLFTHHVYNTMSPAKLAKKIVYQVNPFHSFSSRKNLKTSDPYSHNHRQTPQMKTSRKDIFSPSHKKQEYHSRQQQNAQMRSLGKSHSQYLKQLLKRKKREENLILKNQGGSEIYEDKGKLSQRNPQMLNKKRSEKMIEKNSKLEVSSQKLRKPKTKVQRPHLEIQKSIQSIIINDDAENQDAHSIQEDSYQIKTSHNPPKSQYESVLEFQNKNNKASKRIDEFWNIGKKIDGHHQKILSIKNYGEELKNVHGERIEAFEREVYLCNRMYYEELKNMYEILSGKYGSSNCFKFPETIISSDEINQYKLKHNAQINTKLKKIHLQLDELENHLAQHSKQLCVKHINDPYLKLEKNNFQPELINELFEEIEQISEKIKKINGSLSQQEQREKEQLEYRRSKSIEMILLIAQIKGFVSKQNKFNSSVQRHRISAEYEDIYEFIREVVEKFQDMPL